MALAGAAPQQRLVFPLWEEEVARIGASAASLSPAAKRAVCTVLESVLAEPGLMESAEVLFALLGGQEEEELRSSASRSDCLNRWPGDDDFTADKVDAVAKNPSTVL